MIEYAGIYIVDGIKESIPDYPNFQNINSKNYKIIYKIPYNKFTKENIVLEDEKKIILIEGIILNSKELFNKSISILEYEFSTLNISKIRGQFSGIVIDKKKNNIKLFVDHLGLKRLFYYYESKKGLLIFGNKFDLIVKLMQYNSITPLLDENAAYTLISFGMTFDKDTLIKNLYRLRGGEIINFNQNVFELKKYYNFDNKTQLNIDENDAIEKMDDLFKKAIELEYEKDKEYGYKHIATLSGGLDSRLNILAAHQLGYKNILTVCYSDNNYLDELIAKQIALFLEDEFIFYSLNKGLFLYEIEKNVFNNNGLVFGNSAHARAVFEKINLTFYGLLHTGLVGDGFFGTFFNENETVHIKPTQFKIVKYAFTDKFIGNINEVLNKLLMYDNMEQFLFLERCANGIFNMFWQVEPYTESISPFLYIDYLDFIIKLPLNYRKKHIIHKKWINKKYPESNIFGWEKYKGLKMNTPEILIKPKNILNRIHKLINGYYSYSMNKFDEYAQSNMNLVNFYDNYYNSNKYLLKEYKDLSLAVDYCYKNYPLLQKTSVLTLLSAIKLFNIK